MAYIIAALLLLAFTANVVIGAVSAAPLVGNVAEMIILFGASIAFCVGILRAEAREKAARKSEN